MAGNDEFLGTLVRALLGLEKPPPLPPLLAPYQQQLPPAPPSRRISPLAALYRVAHARTRARLRQPFRIIDARQIPDTESLPHASIGKEVETAILFVDMRESTELHTQAHRITVAKILKAFLGEMVMVARHYRAYVRGFAGDRVMIVPEQGPVAATKAVDIAVSMRDVILRALNPVFAQETQRTIAVGIGIDYGTMLATKVGMKRNPEHTDLIWIGPPANVASKLTDQAGPNEILVSANAYTLLDPRRYPSTLWAPRDIRIAGSIVRAYVLHNNIGFIKAIQEARL